MEHQFFIRQQNLKLYRSLVAASEAAAAKADARQERLLKLLAEEVANEPPPERTKALDAGMSGLTCQPIVFVARNRYRWFGRRDACILPNSDRSWPS